MIAARPAAGFEKFRFHAYKISEGGWGATGFCATPVHV
jgi:hypothetical protein